VILGFVLALSIQGMRFITVLVFVFVGMVVVVVMVSMRVAANNQGEYQCQDGEFVHF
jgi:uncharacterized membrane protein